MELNDLVSEDDLLFDAAGWAKDMVHRRYELVIEGEVLAVIPFSEVRLCHQTGIQTVEELIEAHSRIFS